MLPSENSKLVQFLQFMEKAMSKIVGSIHNAGTIFLGQFCDKIASLLSLFLFRIEDTNQKYLFNFDNYIFKTLM